MSQNDVVRTAPSHARALCLGAAIALVLPQIMPQVAGAQSPAAEAAAPSADVRLLELADNAWAANSINATIFRADPITSDDDYQYAAFYNGDGHVVVAKRELDSDEWETRVTDLTGNIRDAHNGVVVGVDSEGYLHLSWDHHNNPLNYVRSKEPGSLEFTEKMPMTGQNEGQLSYPQFYQLDDGTLLFMCRDGSSGNGNTVLKRYDTDTQTWTDLHDNLVSGEGQRNAYTQACAGDDGSLHLSWVWRETWGVETNHDMNYAVSHDGGETWQRSDGTPYELPITQATAEVVREIPQRHELINQTSMCVDGEGRPVIATYFRPEGEQVVQYFIIYHDGEGWQSTQVGERTTPFSLSGGGSKQIPISRPQVLARTSEAGQTGVYVVFRDVDDREGKVSLTQTDDLVAGEWTTRDLTDFPVSYWEPAYDHARWERDGVLDLYVQVAGQGDGESLQDVDPQPAYVLEWKPAD